MGLGGEFDRILPSGLLLSHPISLSFHLALYRPIAWWSISSHRMKLIWIGSLVRWPCSLIRFHPIFIPWCFSAFIDWFLGQVGDIYHDDEENWIGMGFLEREERGKGWFLVVCSFVYTLSQLHKQTKIDDFKLYFVFLMKCKNTALGNSGFYRSISTYLKSVVVCE